MAREREGGEGRGKEGRGGEGRGGDCPHFPQLVYNITSQQPILCVLLDIRTVYNITLAEIYLIKYYAFNYN